MAELAHSLTRTETLLDSDMFAVLGALYSFLFLVLFVSFLNIYSVDEFEFLNNKQQCFEFKYPLFFIVMYSKDKRIVSKKTFILEVSGYVLSIISIAAFVCTLKHETTIAFIVLGIVAFAVFVFGCITGSIYRNTQNKQ